MIVLSTVRSMFSSLTGIGSNGVDNGGGGGGGITNGVGIVNAVAVNEVAIVNVLRFNSPGASS